MKFLLIFCIFAACLSTASKPKAIIDQAASSKPTSLLSDSIAPAQFDASGKLVQITKSKEQWQSQLDQLAYSVLREEGTERAFTGKLWDNHAKGTYICAGCQLPLFDSATKFDSGTGWPSFFQPIDNQYIKQNVDTEYGMVRTEVECARCGGHLGHVFPDGPKPTGQRYCINSVSLGFVPE
jgi:peptide-methionine (R)-S-oxide reductase